MKILVTGAKGQLGSSVLKHLNYLKVDCRGYGKDKLDVTNFEAVKDICMDYKPDVIIHCASYNQVDAAESNIEVCRNINSNGAENVAKVSELIGSKMVFISTDYVFSGEKTEPYKEEDKPSPKSVYGMSKYDGEIATQKYASKFFIVRTSWLFGENGNNFVNTILELADKKSELNVVCDQIGSPTYTVDLAKAIYELIKTDKYGIYHITNEEYCSWADFAEAIVKYKKIKCKINHIKSEDYNSIAERPKNSKLAKQKLRDLGISILPSWENGLKRYLKV